MGRELRAAAHRAAAGLGLLDRLSTVLDILESIRQRAEHLVDFLSVIDKNRQLRNAGLASHRSLCEQSNVFVDVKVIVDTAHRSSHTVAEVIVGVQVEGIVLAGRRPLPEREHTTHLVLVDDPAQRLRLFAVVGRNQVRDAGLDLRSVFLVFLHDFSPFF